MADNVAILMKQPQWFALNSTGLYGAVTTTAQTISEILFSTSSSLEIPEDATAVRIYFSVIGTDGTVNILENGIPTDTIGIKLSNGNIYDIEFRVNINSAQFILGTGATDATLYFQFYK